MGLIFPIECFLYNSRQMGYIKKTMSGGFDAAGYEEAGSASEQESLWNIMLYPQNTRLWNSST